jgi:hypothetical protein
MTQYIQGRTIYIIQIYIWPEYVGNMTGVSLREFKFTAVC